MDFYYNAITDIENIIKILSELKDNIKLDYLEKEYNRKLANAVHSILDYIDKVDKNIKDNLTDDEKDLIKGFRYINNQLKPDVYIKLICQKGYGSMYPYGYPYDYGPPSVTWYNFEDNSSKYSKNNRKYYDKLFVGRSIVDSFWKIKKIIENIEKIKNEVKK